MNKIANKNASVKSSRVVIHLVYGKMNFVMPCIVMVNTSRCMCMMQLVMHGLVTMTSTLNQPVSI